ncbi:uncharacterized protein B0T15DRAFT_544447 [Chaetomium strumarium]|uniref:Uncharacterized protein n=1 Tax=Chaetomium strumarium TaxID=1170767 RepID=A0AAJ0GKQ2_9PEZI|nr:hypothetical protein B0T15DRAFT_544447 [Chaetomium strumarium]
MDRIHLVLLAVIPVILLLVTRLARRLIPRQPKGIREPKSPYLLDFPPSRRHVLARLPQFEMGAKPAAIPAEVLRAQALPTTVGESNIRRDTYYTTTGLSTREVDLLGRFPDYALLSGVPHPEPCSPSWDISKAVFRPFRPFRWKYHQHMALMKYDPKFWIELTRDYHTTLSARQSLLLAHPSEILFQTPSPACTLAVRELMESLLQFLTRRYPQHFSLSADDDRTLFHNALLGTTTNLLTTPPLRVIFEHIPEDYALMLRDPSDGRYYLRAAAVCSSVGWHIAQHRDKPLREIHGEVPDAGRMGMSMDRWFARLATDGPVARCSWSLEDWEVMFASPAVEEREGRAWRRGRFSVADSTSGEEGGEVGLTVRDVRLRCDAQTLRRLPVSGAVVFNFKAVFTRLEELRDEPFVPALLGTVLREGKKELVEYKCEEHVRRVANEALNAWAAEQVEQGVVPSDWDVGTLDESPFFPGWQEKWRRQQGLG